MKHNKHKKDIKKIIFHESGVNLGGVCSLHSDVYLFLHASLLNHTKIKNICSMHYNICSMHILKNVSSPCVASPSAVNQESRLRDDRGFDLLGSTHARHWNCITLGSLIMPLDTQTNNLPFTSQPTLFSRPRCYTEVHDYPQIGPLAQSNLLTFTPPFLKGSVSGLPPLSINSYIKHTIYV